jgi:hypothetical protein
MTGSIIKRACGEVSNTAVAAVFLAVVMVLGSGNVQAQSVEMFDKSFPFIGNWDTEIDNPNGQDRGNCGGRLGDYGEKLLNCSMPVDQLPLNLRGEAWLKYMDHRQSPVMAECAQVAVPSSLGSGVYISAYQKQLVFETADPSGLLRRDIWMDGRDHPDPAVLFQHGHSIGRWDGNDLVVETTNFTFDPDGTDEHLHMASSVRKKVTERYQLIDDTNLRLIITLDDPTFLSKPFTYAMTMTKKNGGPNPAWRACDPEIGRNEVYSAYPGVKYPDADEQ